jgi:DNA polymerase (family 10)
MLVINPDAHSTSDVALYKYGVDVARRGWLTKENVFNTRSAAEVARAFTDRKKAKGVGA